MSFDVMVFKNALFKLLIPMVLFVKHISRNTTRIPIESILFVVVPDSKFTRASNALITKVSIIKIILYLYFKGFVFCLFTPSTM